MTPAKAREYSSLEHIARSIWLSDYDDRNLFGMFTSYCDAAGGKDHGFTVVSGWLSTVAKWGRFDTDWKLALAHYGVPYFHMSKFVHSKPPFESWLGKEGQRANFLRMLTEVIAENVEYGMAIYIYYDAFKKINQTHLLSERVGNPYSLAARNCTVAARRWVNKNRNAEVPVEYVFEEGDEGEGFLDKLMVRDGYPRPIFRPSRDRVTIDQDGNRLEVKGLLPLQAADFAAYELRKAAVDIGLDAAWWEYRQSIQGLSGIPAWWGVCREVDLIDFCKGYGIPLRQADTPKPNCAA